MPEEILQPSEGPAGRPATTRHLALAALALLYTAALAGYGAVTSEGRGIFCLLSITAFALAAAHALREESFYLPNRRTLAVAAGLCVLSFFSARISIWPEASARAALLGVHFLLLYLSLVALIRDRASLQRAVSFLLVLGALLSAWGAAHRLGSGTGPGGAAYWGWGHSGSFVNRNHFATFLGMLLPLAFYSAAGLRSRSARGGALTERPWFYWGLACVLLVFLLLTLSLGGLIALVVTSVILVADGLGSRSPLRRRTSARAAQVLLAGAALTFLWFGGRPLLERLSRAGAGAEPSALERLLFWKAALAIWAENFFHGTGLSTFAHAFAQHRPPGVPYEVAFAHNEWLQLAAETGLVGLAGFLVLAGVFSSYAFNSRHPIRDNYYRRLSRGALLGLLFAGVHGLFDFPLHIPANLAVAAALAAFITTAASHRESSAPGGLTLPASKLARILTAAALAVLLSALAWQDARLWRAERAARRAEHELAGDPALAASRARGALSLRPKAPSYEHLLARALLAQAARAESAAQRDSLEEQALDYLRRATEGAPRWPRYWTDRGALAARLRKDDEAEAALLRAAELAPNDPYPLLERGRYHWYKGHPALAALDLRAAQEMDPRFTGGVLDLFRKAAMGRLENLAALAPILETAIPDTRQAHTALAALYQEAGLGREARSQLQAAFFRDPDDLALLSRLFDSLLAAGDVEGARQAAARYLERHPEEPQALFLLAQASERSDRWADAVGAYRATLAIKADQPGAYRGLYGALKALGQDPGLAFWRDLAEKYPYNAEYNLELARRLAREGKWLDAVQEYKLAIGKSPGDAKLRRELAAFYLKRDLVGEAIAQLQEQARVEPKSAAPLLEIARLYLRLQTKGPARIFYQRVLDLDPLNAEARAFLTENAE